MSGPDVYCKICGEFHFDPASCVEKKELRKRIKELEEENEALCREIDECSKQSRRAVRGIRAQ